MNEHEAEVAHEARALVQLLVNATCRQQDEPSEDNQNEYRQARDAVEMVVAIGIRRAPARRRVGIFGAD